MLERGDGNTSANQKQGVSTADAIARSRHFYETKLLPDLEEATSLVSHLNDSRDGYLKLRQELEATIQQATSTSVLAHLGQGVHLPVHIPADPLVIVSSGLKESAQDWRLDSGLYLQLNREEAMTFAAEKVVILNRRITRAQERVALIESHAELTTKSIEQLEKLCADPSSTLIDYLQT